MHLFITLLYIASLFFSFGVAKDHDVAVGDNAALTFSPSSLSGVENGDTITFHFLSGNHTLTQSTFDQPCKAKSTNIANREGGVDSGYQDVQNAGGGDRLHYTITVNDASTPLWFFCGQTGHCPRGMVFAVNPTDDKPFSEFQVSAHVPRWHRHSSPCVEHCQADYSGLRRGAGLRAVDDAECHDRRRR
ncbi:hypothetical protein HDZ31DRAFT_43484 [Schizophyllum fasciatum]